MIRFASAINLCWMFAVVLMHSSLERVWSQSSLPGSPQPLKKIIPLPRVEDRPLRIQGRITGFRPYQEAEEKRALPPAERVVPLPITPATPDFQGFGPSKELQDESIPNPNRPPTYVPPPPSPQTGSDSDPSSVLPLGPWRMPSPEAGAPSLDLSQPWKFNMDSETAKGQEAGFVPRATMPRNEFTLFHLPAMDHHAQHAPLCLDDFNDTLAPPAPASADWQAQAYYGKQAVPTQRPWVEWWRPFYTGGIYAPAIPFPTPANPLTPSFLVYGDYRAGIGIHRDNGVPIRTIANRLNLDFDLRLTGTERFHAFMGPLDHNGRFTRLDFADDLNFEREMDAQLDTAFFEGDLGAMWGSWTNTDAPFDLPFTFGLIPLIYQNGIWMEDAIAGVAFGLPWRHSRPLRWYNYDATFFAGFHQVTSSAFANDNDAASVFGTAWFVDAYSGYLEADYAYLSDRVDPTRSYHNWSFGFTRRYFHRLSNAVRVVFNSGQSGPQAARTADGFLLLLENSLITSQPGTLVPYGNFFYGNGSPQSVARAAVSGGILRNTGINFESDALTGYPTLSATGSNSYGMALGVNLLSADFRRQWVLEFAALDSYGPATSFRPPGAQYGFGTRYQQALTNWTLFRIDLMAGLLDNAPDIYGSRFEFRWKF